MVMQSDPGTENFGVANTQTLLCQMYDPMLQGFVQHRWMWTKQNIIPEIVWSQLCWCFTPGFEVLLEEGVDSCWYDPDNTLQLYVTLTRLLHNNPANQSIVWFSDGCSSLGCSKNSIAMYSTLTTIGSAMTKKRSVQYFLLILISFNCHVDFASWHPRADTLLCSGQALDFKVHFTSVHFSSLLTLP